MTGTVAPNAALIALWFAIASPGAWARDIMVRLVNAKTGGALSKVPVTMLSWNGTFDIHKPPLPEQQISEAVTDSSGAVVFHLPEPMPEHIGFNVGGPVDFAGCWRIGVSSPESILQSGVIASYDESKCGKSKARVTVKPGEVIIVERKLTLWEKIRRELP